MPAKGKQLEATIKFKGTVDQSLTNSVNAAKKAVSSLNMKNLNSAFTQMDKGVDNVIQKIGSMAKTAAKAAAATATALTGATAVAAKKVVSIGNEYESAFAGVKKTVDGTSEQFATLRENIVDMSKEIPSSTTEIAQAMEIAGQLGIPINNLESFTETMIKLGTSTNMGAEEAATALARFTNITGMDGSNYEKLGATIVDLGNNFATTESEIVEMSTRLASTGSIIGLSEAEILALSTAMASVGISAEKGGSTMSKVLRNIQTQVETNGKKLGSYASVAGMSTEAFKNSFKNSPIEALSAFIGGINNTSRNGKSAVAVLGDLGLTEVRMSNTLLALANSSGQMTDAINLANKAWEEGTALTEEANKRYETLESRTDILKNNVNGLAIGVYDQIRGPLGEGVQWLTDKVKEFAEYALGPNGIRKWINSFKNGLPSFIKKIKDIGKSVLSIASPVLDLGKWLIKNPRFLATPLITLGTALTTYKIASNITHLVSGVTKLTANPIILGISAVALGIGAIAGAVANSKMKLEELKRLDLESRFGDITLSLRDIEAAANHLLDGDGSITKLNEAFKALSDVDSITQALQESIDIINKGNWKVSIGVALAGDDAEEYKAAVEDYIKNTNKFVKDNQYAVSLAVSLFTDDPDIEKNVNNFYDHNNAKLTQLGSDLGRLVNNALADGILDDDDSKIMEKIIAKQNKMAEIQSKLAAGQMDAEMSLLRTEYGGSALTPESFQTLQDKLSEIESQTKEYYNTEYITAMGALNAMNESGAYIKGGYDAAAKEIEKGYIGKVAELTAKSAEFSANVILDLYGNELDKVGREYFSGDNAIRENDFLEYGMMPWENINQALANSLPKEVRKNVGSLIENLLSSSELQAIKDQLIEAGYDENSGIVQSISKGINDTTALEALSGEADAMWAYVIEQFTTNPMYQDFLDRMKRMGGYIPESVIEGINNKINPSNKQGYFSRVAGKLAEIREHANEVTGHANGGIFNTPHIAAFCENGAESVIPLDGTANALSLWRKTGMLLGMNSVLDGLNLSSSGSSINYSPTLVFNGNSPSESDIESAMRTSQDEFELMMARYLKNRSRLAF